MSVSLRYLRVHAGPCLFVAGTLVSAPGCSGNSAEGAGSGGQGFGGAPLASGGASGGSTSHAGNGDAGQSPVGGLAGSAASAGGGNVAGGTAQTTGAGGMAGSASGGASAGGEGGMAGASGSSGNDGNACGAGDANLPTEPKIPTACKTIQATRHVATGGVPGESNLDTSAIQAALDSCATGQAVKLTSSGTNESFITGPLTVPSGVGLWVDTGATLYGTRDPKVYGAASALITVKGAGSGIYGGGVIDGQGGEPMIGSALSFWDQNGNGGSSPALIQVTGATNFTLYGVTLHNAPKFHVKLSAKGFIVWGITIKTPSKAQNSVATPLTVSSAHNTDGVDPGEAASDGFIVCNKISDGDDHIAIKGSSATGVTNLTIAHNHFEAGHGMSIGSEFTGGVSHIRVYDLSIDGSLGGYANGIRIKSDSSRGGLVNDVTYSDVCVRNLQTPILLTPTYSTATGTDIPQYTNITIQNFHAINGPANQAVTLDGYDAAHSNSVTLDNVVVDGLSAANATGSFTHVTLGPGNVNFTPKGTGLTVTNAITGASTPNPCTGKWVTF